MLYRWITRIAAMAMAVALAAASVPALAVQNNAGHQPETKHQAPVPTSIDEARFTVVTKDAKALADRATALASKISPEAADKMKKQFETGVGGANLDSLSGGIIVMGFPQNLMVGIVGVKADKAEACETALKEMGLQVAKSGDFLVVSRNDAGVTAGKTLIDEAKGRFLGKDCPDGVSMIVPAGRLLQQSDAQIKTMIQSLPALMQMKQASAAKNNGGPMPTTATLRILEGELRVLHTLAKKVDSLRVTLDATPEGVRLDSVITPVAAAASAKADKPAVTAESVRKMLPCKGAMRFAASIDHATIARFIDSDGVRILDEMGMPKADSEKMVAVTKKWMQLMGDGFAMDMVVPGGSIVSGSAVNMVKDADAAIALLAEMPATFDEAGINKFYAQMGIDMKLGFEKAARTVDGVPVHKLTINLKATTGGLEAESIKAMMGEGIVYDIAGVDGVLVYSLGGTPPIEEMIAAVKAKAHPDSKPMMAEKVFGPGARVYVDYSVGDVLAMVRKLASAGTDKETAQKLESMAKTLAGADPLCFAVTHEGKDIHLGMMVPVGLMAKVAEGVKATDKAEDKAADKAEEKAKE